ncbi:MAG: (Dimethylallyl)adenosine tRNA methylthiotransferase MiaB [Candidatus Moranbacteria bacterium GW2011_GWF2_34_56]|nr:MAG: (Dimethylallyl)adenosine tRNA methylthiotransferase MiaB [Candidatus Moranbacteria bacterium GW2011_GWF1_34_10]KKP65406.1 MAG: (Dimethylallyl)adenosine tRNA methylthiotransferase MiaB [Candidatus Moranbacteria bacterium GW2011_GWF2_34_56]
MNFSDSERLASFLNSSGFTPLKIKTDKEIIAKDLARANLVIFNSCGVRKMPEDRAFGQIHNLRKNNPNIKIALTGCISQRKDVQTVLKNKVDLFFSIKDFDLLKNFVIENFSKNLKLKTLPTSRQVKNSNNTQENIAYLSVTPKYTNDFSANVPIMTGCNNFCAYCVVPYARGREVSRPAEEIIDEVKSLVKNDYKEIILLGQNVNSYRSTSPSGRGVGGEGVNFAQLLKMINNIPGNFWIRFMTSHPKDMSDELIEPITQLDKVCESVHLPIQSGSNTVLKNMNRRYTRKHYLGLIKKIKESFAKNKPGAIFSLSSDVIVGFPGETKTQLEKSAEVMRKVKYDMVYFGQFSPRPQTAAWLMEDNVSKPEKERREKYLNEILKKTSLENNQKYLDKIFDVLIESQKGGTYFGKTRTLKNVKVTNVNICHPELDSGSKSLIGKIISVKITKANIWNLEGKIYIK